LTSADATAVTASAASRPSMLARKDFLIFFPLR
jgi:hypothetical protein